MKLFKRPKAAKRQYWYARVRINGRDRWVSSKCQVGKVPKHEAEAKLEERIRELRQSPSRINSALPRFGRSPTLRDVAHEFIAKKKAGKRYSWSSDMYVLNALMKFLGSDTPLESIGPYQIDKLKESRAREIGPSSLNRELSVLRALFNQAAVWGVFHGINPVSQAGLVKIEHRKPRRAFTEAEITLILGACPEYFKDWVLCGLLTGMRRVEIHNAHITHLNLKERQLYVPATKSGAQRYLRLGDTMMEVMERRAAKNLNGYLFLNDEGKRYSNPPIAVSKAFLKICRRVGIEDGVFHALRHTAATRLLDSGVPPTHVQYVLGHKNLNTTQIYSHPEEAARDALLKLDPSKLVAI